MHKLNFLKSLGHERGRQKRSPPGEGCGTDCKQLFPLVQLNGNPVTRERIVGV